MAYEKIRRYPRISVHIPAKITTPSEPDPLSTCIVELSEGGCLLRAKHPHGEGRILTLGFQLDHSPIEVCSKVLYEYADPSGDVLCGLSFFSLFPHEIEAIQGFFRTRHTAQQIDSPLPQTLTLRPESFLGEKST